MTASTRFIGLALFSWAGVRAISLGLVPGSAALTLDRPAAASTRTNVPPLEQTEFPPLTPAAEVVEPGPAATTQLAPMTVPAQSATVALPPARPMRASAYGYPVYVQVPGDGQTYYARSSAPMTLASAEADLPPPRRLFGSAPLTTPLPAAQLASSGLPQRGLSVPAMDATAPSFVRHSRRLELSSWALMRGRPGDLLGANTLAASSGTLGGSQAGARISYWVTPHLAASLRSSTPLGGARGGEVAGGIRYQPFLNLPFSVTAERRQRFGRAGGRNDFALFAEGGLWDRPMPLGFRMDGYAQAGVVGVRTHDLFADGAFTMTRPLFKNLSGGFGVWAGAQPHLYRVDAGPRLTVRMGRSMRIHLDYRQRLAGTAYPSSGPAVTIAGDF